MAYHIEGRRWLRRSSGNTYCVVRIFENGELVYTSAPECVAGGEYYLEMAREWLSNEHPILKAKHPNGCYMRSWADFARHYQVSNSVIDARRKSDL